MTKKKFECNHCGFGVLWYEKMMHETCLRPMDDKWYCEDCMKKIGHEALDL